MKKNKSSVPTDDILQAVESETPTSRWYGLLSDPVENSNKDYYVAYFSRLNVTWCAWGRVTEKNENLTKNPLNYMVLSGRQFNQKVAERIRKGYVEVELASATDVIQAKSSLSQSQQLPAPSATTSPVVSSLDPSVAWLMSFLHDASSNTVRNTVGEGFANIAVSRITDARRILSQIRDIATNDDVTTVGSTNFDRAKRLVFQYMKTIPTSVGYGKVDYDAVVLRFVAQYRPDMKYDGTSEEDRLLQLETALAMKNVSQQAGNKEQQIYDALNGTTVVPMLPSEDTYQSIMQYINDTQYGETGYAPSAGSKPLQVHAIYRVEMPIEVAKWESNGASMDNRFPMWHGSNNENWLHILRQDHAQQKAGLHVPDAYTNGWRCGQGIYFSDRLARSFNYTSVQDGWHNYTVLGIHDVALGKVYKTKRDVNGAPQGYDSVCGTLSHGRNGDEYVIYNVSQKVLRAIVVFKPYR